MSETVDTGELSSSSREASPLSEVGSLLALQIHAFLEASEDVDIDHETVEDLMRILSEHQNSGNSQTEGPNQGLINDPPNGDEMTPRGPEEQERVQWTKQERNQLSHHLKERGMASFIKEYVVQRSVTIPRLLEAFDISLCPELHNLRPQTLLYFLKVVLSHQLRIRDRLNHYNTIEDALRLLQNSTRILVLTGAGISVSCGIPDFRSRDGLYASLKARGDYDLDDPQQMFDIDYFKENPSVFYSFASQIYPSNFTPSPCHRFIKCVEDKGKLLRNYTQNIDTLETLAGVQHVLQCHGSFATATCLQCRRRVPGTEIEPEIMARKVPLCPVCNPPNAQPKKRKQTRKQAKGQWDSDAEDESDTPEYPPGIMKPDITFFGEKLEDQFEHALEVDREKADLLVVIGTSLKVSPVAEILSHLPHSIPQILINKTPIRHINPDIILLGNADDIIVYLCGELGWELPPPHGKTPLLNITEHSRPLQDKVKKRPFTPLHDIAPPNRVRNSHVWLFNGAEGGKWLEDFQHELAESRDLSESQGKPAKSTLVPHEPASQEPKRQKLN